MALPLLSYYANVIAPLYWRANSSVLACLAEQHEWQPASHFFIVGLEGSGHHLINSLGDEIAGPGAGGRWSFPGGSKNSWRDTGEPGGNPRRVNPYKNYLILTRDPVDSLSSALNRFWHYSRSRIDTLDTELGQLRLSLHAMNDFISRIPCERRFYLPYEFLVKEPHKSKHILAHFLGVNVTHPLFDQWVRTKLRSSASTVQWPGPYGVPCHAHWPYLAKKLVDFEDAWPRGWFTNASDSMRNFRAKLTHFVYTLPASLKDTLPRQPMSFCHHRY